LEVERDGSPVELVAWLNACVPQIQGADIDRAMSMLLDLGLREVVSVDQRGMAHSGIRALKRETLFQRRLSANFGVLYLPYVDINTPDDLRRAAELLATNTHSADSSATSSHISPREAAGMDARCRLCGSLDSVLVMVVDAKPAREVDYGIPAD
jgi:hypothetical protein